MKKMESSIMAFHLMDAAVIVAVPRCDCCADWVDRAILRLYLRYRISILDRSVVCIE